MQSVHPSMSITAYIYEDHTIDRECWCFNCEMRKCATENKDIMDFFGMKFEPEDLHCDNSLDLPDISAMTTEMKERLFNLESNSRTGPSDSQCGPMSSTPPSIVIWPLRQ